jgi:prepilin-type N-terminal cleavage/methylation domain-containing protein
MKRTRKAFTLVELLITITIISVLAAMAISSFSNAAHSSRDVVARQQLAGLQEAVNNWVAREVGKVSTAGGSPSTVEDLRIIYNATGDVTARFNLFSAYLDDASRVAYTSDPGTGRITTDAMRQTNLYLTLPEWAAESATTGSKFPRVLLNP